jgi:hypothetical protein
MKVLPARFRCRSNAERLGGMNSHQLLGARGVDVAEAHITGDAREIRRCVKRAIRSGRKLVIVGGGDGTLTQIVGAFAHSKVTLGVIPLGTGNSFARSLGIAPELDAAVDAIAGGRCKRVDLGRVNQTYFANFSTLGLSADIAGATSGKLKSTIGSAAYAVARPDVWLDRHEPGFSYPSGHATTAVVFYGAWVAVLWTSPRGPVLLRAGGGPQCGARDAVRVKARR